MMYRDNLAACVVSNGKILREIDDTIRLPFHSEYQIRVKNKHSRKAMVKIDIDGQNATQNGIIVSPNETFDLDGFMNEQLGIIGKFRFIEKTEEISDHRGDNIEDGIITITYQFEQEQPKYEYPVIYTQPNPWIKKWPYDYKDYTFGTMYLNSNDQKSKSVNLNFVDLNTYKNDNGITVPGSDSSQKFQYGNISVLESSIHTICIMLKGNVQKAVQVKTKVSCSTCGRNNRSNNKFCFNCGTRLYN